MFLPEKPANHWVLLQLFSAQNIQRVSHLGGSGVFSPYGQALSGPEWQQFLPLDDRDLALLR
jgi:hypothetical protein